MIRAVVVGVVLGFALVGMVATGLAYAEAINFSDDVENASTTHNYIFLVREPGYFHIRIFRQGIRWRCVITKIDGDTEGTYDDGWLERESRI